MKTYNVITYKLNRSVKPSEVLATLECLISKNSAQYKNCLVKLAVSIIEYEYEGAFHSNRTKNAVVSICKKYPELVTFLKHIHIDKGEGHIDEEILISNFSDEDYSSRGEIDVSAVREVITKVPHTYNTNYLELIFDEIKYQDTNNDVIGISHSQSGYGLPAGNYIIYERSSYGKENHSYVYFSADDSSIDNMRKLFFEFAEKIPGKYEDTEVIKVL